MQTRSWRSCVSIILALGVFVGTDLWVGSAQAQAGFGGGRSGLNRAFNANPSTSAQRSTTPRFGVVQPTGNLYEERYFAIRNQQARLQAQYEARQTKKAYAAAQRLQKERAYRLREEEKLEKQQKSAASGGRSLFSPRQLLGGGSGSSGGTKPTTDLKVKSGNSAESGEPRPSFWTRLKRLFFGR